jgi:cob(I)alamin adenosyltransferase
MKIYTKTGDDGFTSFYSGKRVIKSHLRVSVYGLIDELNSVLGMILVKLHDERTEKFINSVQKDLFTIGANLSGAPVRIDSLAKRVSEMEKVIDSLDKELPPLKNFILPEGTEASTFLFFGRAVTRRAERELVALSLEEKVDKDIIVYLNRLSDLLFVIGRYLNYKAGVTETVWKKNES